MYWSSFIIKILAKCNNYYRNIINVERRVEHVVISKTFITFFILYKSLTMAETHTG